MTEPEVWAVVGSRDFLDLAAVRAFVRSLPAGSIVVSGGARGVDRTAEVTAEACGLAVESWRVERIAGRVRVKVCRSGQPDELRPEIFLHFPAAAYWRNGRVVRRAEKVKAFHDGHSRGTANTIALALAAGKLAA